MIAIIHYNAGNVASVANALNRLGLSSTITNDAATIAAADKVIFPGVGEAKSAMAFLRQYQLDEVIIHLTQPVLGICLGMQLMCTASEEGNTIGLGIFDTQVKKFPAGNIVPHMGWNSISFAESPLLQQVNTGSDVYFVHSYYARPCAHTIATCNYILPFSAALQKNNFYATQFHPEKSADTGLQILKNFLSL